MEVLSPIPTVFFDNVTRYMSSISLFDCNINRVRVGETSQARRDKTNKGCQHQHQLTGLRQAVDSIVNF